MNAAFLLMTTAWLAAGQTPPPPPPAAAPAAPVAPAACGGSCGGYTDPCGCEPFGHRLRTHLRGLFASDCSGGHIIAHREYSAPACCTSTPAYVAPRFEGCGCGRTFEFHLPKLFHRECGCAPVKTCAPDCDPCGRVRFLDRLRAWWNTSSCHTCSSCGSTASPCANGACGGSVSPAPVTPAPATEPIGPGKKLPPAPARFENSTSIPQGPAPQSAPAIQNETPAIPVVPPGIDNKNPY